MQLQEELHAVRQDASRQHVRQLKLDLKTAQLTSAALQKQVRLSHTLLQKQVRLSHTLLLAAPTGSDICHKCRCVILS